VRSLSVVIRDVVKSSQRLNTQEEQTQEKKKPKKKKKTKTKTKKKAVDKEGEILQRYGTCRDVCNKVYEEDVCRFAINEDGHCLFDSLCFLYLYYVLDDENADVVNLDIVSKYGWRPDISDFEDSLSCRGNLLEVLIENLNDLLSESESNKQTFAFKPAGDEETTIRTWFQYYAAYNNISSKSRSCQSKNYRCEEFPCSDIAMLVFCVLFNHEVVDLCIHTYDSTAKQYHDKTVLHADCDGYLHYYSFSSIADMVACSRPKKKIHLWHYAGSSWSDNMRHFEPALPKKLIAS